jgi:hypothetical protein
MLDIRRIAIAGFAAIALSACASHDTVKNADADAGIVRTFDAPYERVRVAAVDGLRALQLSPSAIEDVPEGTAIYVARPPHGFSWGEVGRIIVQKSNSPPTSVRVVYEKRMAFQFASSESAFARNLFAKMDVALANGPAK